MPYGVHVIGPERSLSLQPLDWRGRCLVFPSPSTFRTPLRTLIMRSQCHDSISLIVAILTYLLSTLTLHRAARGAICLALPPEAPCRRSRTSTVKAPAGSTARCSSSSPPATGSPSAAICSSPGRASLLHNAHLSILLKIQLFLQWIFGGRRTSEAARICGLADYAELKIGDWDHPWRALAKLGSRQIAILDDAENRRWAHRQGRRSLIQRDLATLAALALAIGCDLIVAAQAANP